MRWLLSVSSFLSAGLDEGAISKMEQPAGAPPAATVLNPGAVGMGGGSPAPAPAPAPLGAKRDKKALWKKGIQKNIKKHIQKERELSVIAPSNAITFRDVNEPPLDDQALDVVIGCPLQSLNAKLLDAFQLVEKVVWVCQNADGSGDIHSDEEWNKYMQEWGQNVLTRKEAIVASVISDAKAKLWGASVDDVAVGAMNVWEIACHKENIKMIDDRILKRLVQLLSFPIPADIACSSSKAAAVASMQNCRILLASRCSRKAIITNSPHAPTFYHVLHIPPPLTVHCLLPNK